MDRGGWRTRVHGSQSVGQDLMTKMTDNPQLFYNPCVTTSTFLSVVISCYFLIFLWVWVIWSWLQLLIITFYEISGTVAQNVNTFILLHFPEKT